MRLLITNVFSVLSILGGGHCGYLEMPMTGPEYDIMYVVTFEPLIDPFPLPIIGPDMTNVEANGIVRLHNELHQIYTEYHSVDLALKRQIVMQYDSIYLSAMEYYMVFFPMSRP